jgi:hypothetical protein
MSSTSEPSTGRSVLAEQRDEILTATKETLKRLGEDTRIEMRKPTTGAAIAGALVVGAAVLLGPGEAAVGAASAYVVYRMLKRRDS